MKRSLFHLTGISVNVIMQLFFSATFNEKKVGRAEKGGSICCCCAVRD